MAETVKRCNDRRVPTTPGPTAKFAWSSATAGKNWTSAYPAIYALNVASDLDFR
jgi:hypothetical protein